MIRYMIINTKNTKGMFEKMVELASFGNGHDLGKNFQVRRVENGNRWWIQEVGDIHWALEKQIRYNP